MKRRDFLAGAVGSTLRLRAQRPEAPQAAMAGDVAPGAAMIWSRSLGPARMLVSWKTSEAGEWHKLRGPHCLDVTDYTGRAGLTGLPPGQTILYEVRLEDLSGGRNLSEPVSGRFRTPPGDGRNVRFLWSGDQVGQGWGIDLSRGGMKIFETMRKLEPDFFLHSGDVIYADQPLQTEVKLADGTLWRNLVTEEKSKVAETLNDFRGCYRYNLLDENFRNFVREIPQIWQWDDHEVMNNWSPSKSVAADQRYREKSVPLLVARASRAFREYAPMRPDPDERERIYRRISYGPLLDVFVIDMRSYRGPNTFNKQTAESGETVYLGQPQLEWLAGGLRSSRAVWKVIASDMPLGLIVPDGADSQGRLKFENSSNGNGQPAGRELEIARLLSRIKSGGVRNIVWLTADVHYTAAHYYDPQKAKFSDFLPFWEFISGPMHAGTFGPAVTDDTFGPQVIFQKAPPKGQSNLPPSAGFQFFGDVRIDARRRSLSVHLRDATGASLYEKELPDERPA